MLGPMLWTLCTLHIVASLCCLRPWQQPMFFAAFVPAPTSTRTLPSENPSNLYTPT